MKNNRVNNRESFDVDMQRIDNGHQFSTSVFAVDVKEADMIARLKFPESNVLIIWSPNPQDDVLTPTELDEINS